MPNRPWLRRALVRAAPPLSVAGVAGLITVAVATGHPVSGVRPAAVTTAAQASSSVAAEWAPLPTHGLTAALSPGATRALRVLSPQRAGARSSRSQHRGPLHRWVRPNGGPLTSPFGYRWGRLHAGIDLAGPYGSPILAATDGCITYAGPMSGYGEVLKMTDWDGTETVYGHMSAFVRRSGCVKAGTVIARVGSAGDATGPHLHFEVHVGGAPVDPLRFLARHGLHI